MRQQGIVTSSDPHLEEIGLRRVQASVASRHNDIVGGHQTNTCRRTDLVLLDLIPQLQQQNSENVSQNSGWNAAKRFSKDQWCLPEVPGPHLCQVSLGEDEANIANQLVQQGWPLVITSLLAVQADRPLHHGVLAHEHNAVTHVTETL